jgi:hypothetical protein
LWIQRLIDRAVAPTIGPATCRSMWTPRFKGPRCATVGDRCVGQPYGLQFDAAICHRAQFSPALADWSLRDQFHAAGAFTRGRPVACRRARKLNGPYRSAKTRCRRSALLRREAAPDPGRLRTRGCMTSESATWRCAYGGGVEAGRLVSVRAGQRVTLASSGVRVADVRWPPKLGRGCKTGPVARAKRGAQLHQPASGEAMTVRTRLLA